MSKSKSGKIKMTLISIFNLGEKKITLSANN